jgi:hypothetical protein
MRRAFDALVFSGLLWGILSLAMLGCGDLACVGGTAFPTIIAVSPNPVSAFQFQSGGFLIVDGTNFVDGSVVFINGVGHPTAFVNGGQLRVALLPADLGLGNMNIFVNNPQTFGTTLFLSCRSVGSSQPFAIRIIP